MYGHIHAVLSKSIQTPLALALPTLCLWGLTLPVPSVAAVIIDNPRLTEDVEDAEVWSATTTIGEVELIDIHGQVVNVELDAPVDLAVGADLELPDGEWAQAIIVLDTPVQLMGFDVDGVFEEALEIDTIPVLLHPASSAQQQLSAAGLVVDVVFIP